jgi:hypothetical protein
MGLLIAEFTGPLRTCAATLLELEGQTLAPPREALEKVVAGFGGTGWEEVLAHFSGARRREPLAAAVADETLLRMIEMAGKCMPASQPWPKTMSPFDLPGPMFLVFYLFCGGSRSSA